MVVKQSESFVWGLSYVVPYVSVEDQQSVYYDSSRQFTIKWDDPRFNIWWPSKYPILSRRDEIV